jgi:flavin-dependent dehydrogenase
MMISPRRTVLDALLLDAAREAGAEVRESTTVEDLRRDGNRVIGVQLRNKTTGATASERAAIVVGADGHHSTVGRLVGAAEYGQRPTTSLACYTYWDGLSLDRGELHSGNGWAVGAWPTHDGLTMTYLARRADDWDSFRRAPEGNLLATLDDAGTLGKRAREARRVGPVRCTNDLGGGFRQASGPGWALVGDAGLFMDPITGLGMGHALRDAELLSAALSSNNAGRAQARYGKQRDKQTRPLYDLTAGLAQLRDSTPVEARMFAAVAADPQQSATFLGVIGGAVPTQKFFAPRNLIRLVGSRDFLALAKSRPR